MTYARLVASLVTPLIGLGAPFFLLAAENSLSVTVTPPLFQLTIGPSESWTSTLKIVNNNTYDVTYYATPVDFIAEGEQGKGRFLPLSPEEASSTKSTLATWIEIAREPIRISRGASGNVPFTVHIPENASPGGHYAAILVGTKPGAEDAGGSAMKIASMVSSLLFVRIKGDVHEKGRIREFRAEQSLYQVPKADFLLRFENTGNTHLKPRGDIVLFNMWGKERGKVAINQLANFGNVLPESIRKFTFSWEGEASIVDIGRYSAVVTLAFGEEETQTLTAKTYFWVVPVVPVALTISLFIFFILSLLWLIRRYIRRALMLEKSRLGIAVETAVPTLSIDTLIEPLKEGVVDLRNMGRAPKVALPRLRTDIPQRPLSLFEFAQKYSLFFFFMTLVALGALGLWLYFDTVLIPERSYQISGLISEEETP